MKNLIAFIIASLTLLSACGAGKNKETSSSDQIEEASDLSISPASFSADSAYAYVKRQVDFGPRVPNSSAHKATGKWLASELERHGAKVTLQPASLKAFDGTNLEALNIVGSFNPDAKERIILISHWDSRPWADMDPNEANRKTPVPAANDGASGVGVLLEVARQLGAKAPDKGVDILFVDAEDWGSYNNDESWALGARHYANNIPEGLARPQYGVLLDMVGGRNAVFPKEYISNYHAPQLLAEIWTIGNDLGFGNYFINDLGGQITDDHVEFIKAGIPVVDIIALDPASGFDPTWHTLADDMDNIDKATLGAVGTTLLTWLRNQ